MRSNHEPVLLREAIELLNVREGGRYIDATLGGGGHGEVILKGGGVLLGIDQDPDAVRIARRKLDVRGWKVEIIKGNFRDIEKTAKENDFASADGVLFDLGISSMQLEAKGRGFSFNRDELLDMRMDPSSQSVTAADLLNSLHEDQLYELFKETSQKNIAWAVARAIVRARPLTTTKELVGVVGGVVPRRKIHPATTIFMALRMAVNSEVENLEMGLSGALNLLGRGGRVVVISFHSGEDRLVKEFFRSEEKRGRVSILTKKPIVPSGLEIENNPRARSAKLRVAEKL